MAFVWSTYSIFIAPKLPDSIDLGENIEYAKCFLNCLMTLVYQILRNPA